MTIIHVKAHTKGVPDPLTPVIETRRQKFARKWGVELVTVDDPRLSVPVADPVPGPGRVSIESIRRQAAALAKMVRWPS